MLENLYFAKFTLIITARDCISLPPYKGSTFRGGFGNTFKRIVCIGRNKDCETCLLKSRCIYVYIFETPPPEDTTIMRKYRTAPHPFVIEPPMSPRFTEGNEKPPPLNSLPTTHCIWPSAAMGTPEGKSRGIAVFPPPLMGGGKGEGEKKGFSSEPIEDTKTIFGPGEKISFSLILIGKSIDSLPYFIYTFEELGNSGIGKGRGRYILEDVSVAGDNPESVYSVTDRKLRGPVEPRRIQETGKWDGGPLTLSFITPTRIVYDEHLIEKPEFHILMRNLLRRIAHLSYFHCGGDPSRFDFTGAIDRAMKISSKQENLQWYDWERYSARQDTRMKLGGFIGDITFEGDLGEFIPYLKAGEFVHIGKGTSFGLGKYVMIP